MPAPNVEGALSHEMQRDEILSLPADWEIVTFQTLADLADQIVALIGTDYLLRELEISAHGDPSSVDGIAGTTFDQFQTLQDFAYRWIDMHPDDESDIYLSGCNTGCRAQLGVRGIAEQMADLIPPGPPQLPAKAYRCTVYGAVGTLNGTHAGGTCSATESAFLFSRGGTADTTPHQYAFRGFRGENSA